MVKRALVTACLFIVPAASHAGSFDWADQDQMSVVTKLGSAYASANVCNFEIDTDGTAKIIKDKIAPAGKLTPEMASSLMFSVVGIGAMQAQLLGIGQMNKRQLAGHCAKMLSYFGPSGSSLSGILKP
ncbi:hypothetical protein MKK69_04610 [Methylobacterium sp. J-026]|uniref:hypothetical protein n=1 Tax=Methylobacterium sp. J-026 TaxID=2836624 RepID=UPI001FB9E523|nr:hypothetical protein [Methylobacterium sp. J-026]MCJ2133349.1 hypothetical protein [Methylobacterium sp. J-026]